MQKEQFIFLDNSASDELIRNNKNGIKDISLIKRNLIEMGILPNEAFLYNYTDLTKWHRGGTESYITTFKISYILFQKEITLIVLLKAIISMIDVNLRWEQYMNRINQLNKFGIYTPKIYCYKEGVIYQQYIQYSLDEWVSILVKKNIDLELFYESVKILFDHLLMAGFRPTGLLHNLRTDGKELFLVDFGNDLGEFSKNNSYSDSSKIYFELKNWFSNIKNLYAD